VLVAKNHLLKKTFQPIKAEKMDCLSIVKNAIQNSTRKTETLNANTKKNTEAKIKLAIKRGPEKHI